MIIILQIIALKYLKNIKNKRFKYFSSQKNETLYKARNLACEQTSGKYIAFLDTDDWWDKNYLSSQKKNFDKLQKYDYLYSNVLVYHEKKNNFVKYKNTNLPDWYNI